MSTKIMLCTDVPYMADAVPKLFDDFCKVQVLRRNELPLVKETLFHYHHFVLGLMRPEETDWALCRSIIDGGFPSVYLMLRHLPSLEEWKRAEKIGIRDILLDPLFKVREMAANEEDLFSVLKVVPENLEENLIYLGFDTYFHTKELWVGSEDASRPLTKLEMKLLRLFVENRGAVISKNEIAEEIWDGPIELSSVRKLIKRLREKLGPARELIVGRKQGGYIFKEEE